MSHLLKQQLTRSECQERKTCFEKLRRFIRQAPPCGYDVCSYPFPPYPPMEDVRIDVEIIKGRAFCDEN